jgi:hypothetical protein
MPFAKLSNYSAQKTVWATKHTHGINNEAQEKKGERELNSKERN